MRKLYLFMLTLLLCIGASAIDDGVYVIKNTIDRRGTLIAVDGKPNLGLAEVTLPNYTNRSETPVTNGDKWYVFTREGSVFIYNLGNSKFLASGTANLTNATFADGCHPLSLGTVSVSGTNYIRIVSGSLKLACAPGYQIAEGTVKWKSDSENASENLTFESQSSDGYDTQIAAALEKYNAYASKSISDNISGASFWNTASVYPAGIKAITSHVGVQGHTVKKHEKIVTSNDVATVTFTYSRGNHGLRLLGVDLVDSNGAVVASEYGEVRLGTGAVKTYTLSGFTPGTYLLRYYICDATVSDGHNASEFNGTAVVRGAAVAGDAEASTFFTALTASASTKYNASNSSNNGSVGCYTQASIDVLNNAKDLSDVSALNASVVVDAINGLVLVTPATGKFYRLKNVVSERYMTDVNGTPKMKNGVSPAENRPSTVFYLDENNELLSYSLGQYLNCAGKSFAAVGTKHAGEFGVAYGGVTPNVVTYKNNGKLTFGNKGDNAQIDQGSSANEAGYNWTFEEVTWLPVPINETAGYATIYSPVALELSYGRVEAYTAEVNLEGTKVVLTSQEKVLPETGMILKYKDGIEGGCVYLEVTTGEQGTSDLSGTFADTKISATAYVLSMQEEGVGLYKAIKNQRISNANDSWLNQAFRAYLPESALPAVSEDARVLTFDFDDNAETGINAVEIEEATPANAAIYDLSGRRVQSSKSGLYIINGKKVIK